VEQQSDNQQLDSEPQSTRIMSLDDLKAFLGNDDDELEEIIQQEQEAYAHRSQTAGTKQADTTYVETTTESQGADEASELEPAWYDEPIEPFKPAWYCAHERAEKSKVVVSTTATTIAKFQYLAYAPDSPCQTIMNTWPSSSGAFDINKVVGTCPYTGKSITKDVSVDSTRRYAMLNRASGHIKVAFEKVGDKYDITWPTAVTGFKMPFTPAVFSNHYESGVGLRFCYPQGAMGYRKSERVDGEDYLKPSTRIHHFSKLNDCWTASDKESSTVDYKFDKHNGRTWWKSKDNDRRWPSLQFARNFVGPVDPPKPIKEKPVKEEVLKKSRSELFGYTILEIEKKTTQYNFDYFTAKVDLDGDEAAEGEIDEEEANRRAEIEFDSGEENVPGIDPDYAFYWAHKAKTNAIVEADSLSKAGSQSKPNSQYEEEEDDLLDDPEYKEDAQSKHGLDYKEEKFGNFLDRNVELDNSESHEVLNDDDLYSNNINVVAGSEEAANVREKITEGEETDVAEEEWAAGV
jgi:hypothetical protein